MQIVQFHQFPVPDSVRHLKFEQIVQFHQFPVLDSTHHLKFEQTVQFHQFPVPVLDYNRYCF